MDTNLCLFNLKSDQGFKIFGETAYDHSGYSVSGAGDINGDGFADIVIGAPYGVIGKGYVVFGKPNGFSDIRLSNLGGTQGFRIIGESEHDTCGFSVSGAGDVNGDGFADIVIGAPYGDIGKGYVIFGKANGFSDISLTALKSIQGFRIIGERIDDYCGYSVSGAGDVNGDGFADIIIGAFGAVIARGNSYVIFGKAGDSGDIYLDELNSTQGFRIIGENFNDFSGYSVGGAGDVNNDGFADVIIGAINALNGTGKSYVVFGKADNFSDIILRRLNNTQGFSLFPEQTTDWNWSGHSVSGAGDVNGDGIDDFMVGSSIASPLGRDDAGKVDVIFGRTGGFSDINLNTYNSSQGFRILGAKSGNSIGASVRPAGDINNDGFADIIIGADYANLVGKSYVVFGSDDWFDIDLSMLNKTQGFIVIGENIWDGSGFSGSGAGDVNGDGFADIIVGSYDAYNSCAVNEIGRSHLIFGGLNNATSNCSIESFWCEKTYPKPKIPTETNNGSSWMGFVAAGTLVGIAVVSAIGYFGHQFYQRTVGKSEEGLIPNETKTTTNPLWSCWALLQSPWYDKE